MRLFRERRGVCDFGRRVGSEKRQVRYITSTVYVVTDVFRNIKVIDVCCCESIFEIDTESERNKRLNQCFRGQSIK